MDTKDETKDDTKDIVEETKDIVEETKDVPDYYKATGWTYSYEIENKMRTLAQVPMNKRRYKVCLLAVKMDGMALKDVPREHHKPELYRAAIEQNYMALKYMLFPDISMCKFAVGRDPTMLQYVPPNLRTYSICIDAVRKNPAMIVHVPLELRDENLCLTAVNQDPMMMEHVPEELRSAEMCYESVLKNGLALKFAPIVHRDYRNCRIAVLKNGDALEFVPEEICDNNLRAYAAMQKAYAADPRRW